MAGFALNVNIQTLIGLFFMTFCLVVAVFGYLLARYRFLDGQSFDFSQNLGRILMIASGILAFATGLMLIYVQITLRGG